MSPTKQRTILMYTIGGLFLVAVVWIIFSFATGATLTLTTNDSDATWLVHETSPEPQNINVPSGGKRVDLRVEAGTYTVTVKNKSTSSIQIVTVGIGEHKTITLNLNSINVLIPSPQPVTSMGAGSFMITSASMTFVDRNSSDSHLYYVDSSNRTRLLDGRHTYQTIQWADDSFGIGLVKLGSLGYGLTKIEDKTVTDVALPFTSNDPIGYAVAPNRAWYASDGHTVYRANADGSFTKVYTAGSNKNLYVVSASNDAALIAEKDKNTVREGNLIALHTDGTKYQIEGEVYESAWSPSGDKLVTSGDTAEIFDNKLNVTHVLPQGNVGSPVWLDDNTLLYSLSGNVWRYDLSDRKAHVIATVSDTVGTISTIGPDSTRDYLYISVYRNGFATPTFSLGRVSIGSKPVPDSSTAALLSVIFPYTESGCTLNTMNFSALTVLFSTTSAHPNCVEAAKSNIVNSKVLRTDTTAALNFQQLP